MKTIYLVRHGQSVLNEGKNERCIDDATAPLTDLGREQARFLAQRVAKLPIDVLFASPFERTKQTAQCISEATGHSVEYSSLFTERKYPDAIVGKLRSDREVKELIEAGLRSSQTGEGSVAGVETFEKLKIRAADALKFLENRAEDNVLVVGHGFFTRMLVARILYGETLTPVELAPLVYGLRTTNTGVSIIKYDERDPHCTWWLQVWNDHAHLG